jgi:hypothetical protein
MPNGYLAALLNVWISYKQKFKPEFGIHKSSTSKSHPMTEYEYLGTGNSISTEYDQFYRLPLTTHELSAQTPSRP